MIRGRRSFAAAAGVLAACLSGCAADQADSRGEFGRRILRIAYDREIDVLNVFTSQNLVDISFSMVEGLVTTNERNEYIPVLAKEIPTEANGRVVRGKDGSVRMTWPLQEGVRWHDGVPFTSADVCFTWRFVIDPKSMTYNREQYVGIKSCDTPDDHTVVFTWDGAYAYYAGLFEGILPRHVFLKPDGRTEMTVDEIVNYEPYNRGSRLVGTGPFKFAEWKTGEYIRVVRNPDYWRGKDFPQIDEIVWAFIPDNNTRLLALKSGRYDWGRIQPTQVSVVRNLATSDVHLIDANSVMHFDLAIRTDLGRLLFDDVRVRRAMFHAVDRDGMARKLMEGAVKVAEGPINPNSPYHNAKVTTYPYDLAESRRVLDEAGWTVGPDGVRQKGGRRFSFVMLNRAGTTDRILLAQVIQAGLKAVGIEVIFETLESASWTQRWRSGKWEAMVSAWFLPADPGITGLYACKGANNMAGFCDPGLDEILERSDKALSFETRMPLLHQAQAMLAEQARMLPLYQNVMPEVVTRRVKGYRGSGTNFGSFWNLWEWQLEEAGELAVGPYIARRLLQMAPLMVGISIIVFALIQMAPGGPEAALLSSGRFVDPSVVEAYRIKLGVDQPMPIQYFRWATTALTGDLGVSYATTRPVIAMIAERLPATLELMGLAFLLAAVLAFGIGLVSALRPHSWIDLLGTGSSFVGIAMPVFWLGLLLQLVFAVELGWAPISGTHTVGASSFADHVAHLMLPAIVLASRYVASWSRYFRASLITALQSDYVRTARAQGLTETRVLFVHAVRNALVPVVSAMALGLADLVSGAVITETVFAWPGIGRLFVQAMFARDYPVLMGVLLMGSVTVIVCNLVADVLYGLLDPRIRYE